MDLREITEGTYNYLIRKTKLASDEIEALHEYRFSICVGCDSFRKDNTCGECGCDMRKKTRARRGKCPLGKW